jgi:hypothetical protein
MFPCAIGEIDHAIARRFGTVLPMNVLEASTVAETDCRAL